MSPQVITGLFTISGTILGALIGCITSLHLAQKNAKREAGNKLRAAFAPERAKMRLCAPTEVENLLTEAFPRHAVAVEEYRFHISEEDLDSYDKAWREYYEVGGSVRFFDYYQGMGMDECRDLFDRRVSSLMEFSVEAKSILNRLISCLSGVGKS